MAKNKKEQMFAFIRSQSAPARGGVIGTREARELIRNDSKYGALKWHYLKSDN